MDESEYWRRLEYRVCRELRGLADDELRCLWCDGFIAEGFHADDTGATISGRLWIGRSAREQEAWRFHLFVGRSVHCQAEVPWDRLLPAEDATGWLSVDPPSKVLTIRPPAAYPEQTS